MIQGIVNEKKTPYAHLKGQVKEIVTLFSLTKNMTFFKVGCCYLVGVSLS